MSDKKAQKSERVWTWAELGIPEGVVREHDHVPGREIRLDSPNDKDPDMSEDIIIINDDDRVRQSLSKLEAERNALETERKSRSVLWRIWYTFKSWF